MNKSLERWVCGLSLSFAMTFACFATPTKIPLWHSFSGDLAVQLHQLVRNFNHSQSLYKVEPIYKGDYVSVLTSFAAAFQANKQPALVQVFEVGTTTMLHPSGVIQPVGSLLQDNQQHIPEKDFFPAVNEFYSDNGVLQALPFNVSVPVLFYNKALLQRVGYSAANFPKDWDGLEILVHKLQQAGVACGYTTAFPSWIHIESFAALHGIALRDPVTHIYRFDQPAIIQHLSRLRRWQTLHYFEYGGRADEATALFTSGHCALFSQSSGGYKALASLVPFGVGVAPLPLDRQISTIRYPNVVGGAALWAVSGHSKQVYAGIAAFFAYWTRPEVQQLWSKQTGYIPLGSQGVYADIWQTTTLPTMAIAAQDFAKGHGLGVQNARGPLNFLRMINDEELEAIFAGIKTPTEAMQEAMQRSSYALLRFEHNTGKMDKEIV